ncbi:MAG: hypothetical protein R3E79_37980 [Caldilineaceae bacterium]
MRFFFPAAYAQIDWRYSVQFLDKELHQVVRAMPTWAAATPTFLRKVRLLDGTKQWILIHVEVQGQVDTDFDARMFTYNYRLWDWHGKPV